MSFLYGILAILLGSMSRRRSDALHCNKGSILFANPFRLILTLTCCIFFVEATSAGNRADPSPGLVKVLASEGDEGALREGSGFVVGFSADTTFIVTAAHVVSGDPEPTVRFASNPHGGTYKAHIVEIDVGYDVAALKVHGYVEGARRLPFDERGVEITDPLEAIGYPSRINSPRTSTAAAAAIEGGKIVLDRELAEGHSGGPLLRDGLVVGLVKETESKYAFALPANLVRQILSGWSVPSKVQNTQSSAALVAPPSPQPSTGLTAASFGDSAPSGFPCFGEVTSPSGGDRPLQLTASPGATARFSLQAGTVVQLVRKLANSGHTWYQVQNTEPATGAYGWIQDDHLQLSSACPR